MVKKAVENTENAKKQAEVKKVKSTKDAKTTSRKIKKKDTELKELKQKHEELNDKFLRLFSEFDNYRKRTAKERLELTKTASEEVILSLLPVLDDFERALNIAETNNKNDSFVEGINLIYKKLKTTLESRGLKAMNTKGEEFNTDFHEALTKTPAPAEDMKGKIVDEIEKGYLLNEKVIRYAKVVVGS